MHVDIITTLEDFESLRADWEAVYRRDPESQIYLSWSWMKVWLRITGKDWCVLAARPSVDSPYVGFFPLRLRTRTDAKGAVFSELAMAGNRFADYTGFIVEPECAHQIVSAFAKAIRQIPWSSLHLEGLRVRSDYADLFLSAFPTGAFSHVPRPAIDKHDGTDHDVCPYVALPASWEDFLRDMSANRRQKLRRLLRKTNEGGPACIRVATSETFKADLACLIGFWKTKWRPRKGDLTEVLAHNFARVLSDCFEIGQVELVTLVFNGQIIAAHANLVDPVKGEVYFLVGARAAEADCPSPGLLLHADAIKRAIEAGFSRYDFLRGNESYKYTFANAERRIASIVVAAKSKSKSKSGAGKPLLHPSSCGTLLKLALKAHRAGDLNRAIRYCADATAANPDSFRAHLNLGNLHLKAGGAARARRIFSFITERWADEPGGWRGLAAACHACGDAAAALQARRKLFALEDSDTSPGNPVAKAARFVSVAPSNSNVPTGNTRRPEVSFGHVAGLKVTASLEKNQVARIKGRIEGVHFKRQCVERHKP